MLLFSMKPDARVFFPWFFSAHDYATLWSAGPFVDSERFVGLPVALTFTMRMTRRKVRMPRIASVVGMLRPASAP